MLAYMNAEALDAHARARARCTSGAARAASSGTRARPRATSSASRRSATTATPTRCWRWSKPAGPGVPHRRADLLLPRRAGASRAARGAPDARAHDRAASRRSGPTAPTPRSLLADPARIGEKVQEEAEEVARAAREESDERVAEEAADVLYHLCVLLASRGLTPRRRRAGARWPSPAVARAPARGPAVVAVAATQTRELLGSYDLVPLRETLIDDCETPVSAFLKLREHGRPCFLLESADHGRVGRYSFIGYRPRKVLRWSLGDPGDPYALVAGELARCRAAPLPGLAAVRRRRRRDVRLRPRARPSSRSANRTRTCSGSPTWR